MTRSSVVVGLVTVRFLRMVSGEILSSPALERRNYRGHAPDRRRALHRPHRARDRRRPRGARRPRRRRPKPGLTLARRAVLFAVFGFGFLGLVDDLAAVGEDRGFKGHLRRAARGPGHHRPAQAGRRRGGRDRARGHAGLQVGAHPDRRRRCSSRSPPTSATCSTARPGARSSRAWSPTCRSRSPSAPSPSASRSRR